MESKCSPKDNVPAVPLCTSCQPLSLPVFKQVNMPISSTKWHFCIPSFLAMLVPFLLPAIHLKIFFLLWGSEKSQVFKNNCSCSCWDTIFKGPYEDNTGARHFKHVYFNSDRTSLKLWAITVLMVVSFYEAFKYLCTLQVRKNVRISMGLMLTTSVHSHYYGWWVFWNYWNDEFYQMWYHQFFFTLTELVSTVIALDCLDKEREITLPPMTIIFCIATFHIWCSFWDQYAINIFLAHGESNQVLRDMALMITDVLQCCVALIEIQRLAKKKGTSFKTLFLQNENVALMVKLIFGMFVVILLLPSGTSNLVDVGPSITRNRLF